MYAEDRALISFTSVDNAVDKLFRVYLDTQLIGFARDYKDPDDYDEWVSAYRERVLDPYTRVEALPANVKSGSPEANGLKEKKLLEARARYKSSEQFKAAQAYLYWFDIRAQFWRDNRPSPDLLQLVEPQPDLINLGAESRILRGRLERANVALKSGGGYPSAGASRLAKERHREIVLLELIAEDTGKIGKEKRLEKENEKDKKKEKTKKAKAPKKAEEYGATEGEAEPAKAQEVVDIAGVDEERDTDEDS